MSWFFSLFSNRGVSSEERKRLSGLEKNLGYHFKNLTLLRRALTHKSYANEKRLSSSEQNERYEFLGDAVLELSISHIMMNLFQDFTEGDLSKLRAAVVNETSLALLAREMKVGDYMYLGRGEDQCQGREKDSLLSDAYEAVLGALYLDSNFETVYRVIHRQFKDLMKQAKKEDITRDYKTKLQEVSQDRFKAIPRYQLVSEQGPDHDKTFEIHLTIKDKIYGKGAGKSKKQAEQNAAQEALETIER